MSVDANKLYLFKYLPGATISLTLASNETAFQEVVKRQNLMKAGVASDKTLNSTFLKNLGFNMQTMLLSCYFNGIQCYASDFKFFRTNYYGNCYIFNPNNGSVRQTTKSGLNSGLYMELFTGTLVFYIF